jgi:hypothetical protein
MPLSALAPADVRTAGHHGIYPSSVSSIGGARLADAFWCSVAVNFSASCIGLVVVMTGHWGVGFLIPLICMALSGVVGVAALFAPRTRRIGGGGLLGVLVSVLGFIAVLAIVVVGYFVVGGNELS